MRIDYMQDNELIFLEGNGSISKYLCKKDNTIVEAEGAIAVPGVNKILKYRGIVIWSLDIPITKQINDMRKICGKYLNVSSKDILNRSREKNSWIFGEFFDYEAIDILKASKKYNLCIEMINIDSGEKLIL